MFVVQLWINDQLGPQYAVTNVMDRDELCVKIADQLDLAPDSSVEGYWSNYLRRQVTLKNGNDEPFVELMHDGIDEWKYDEEVDVSFVFD